MIPVFAKIGIITLASSLLLVAQSTPPPASTAGVVTSEQYLAQVDKTNAALDNYLKLPCKADPKDIKAASTELKLQMDNLNTAYENLPDNQDALTQDRETELFVGFIELANKYVPLKIDACSSKVSPKPTTPASPAPPDDAAHSA